MVSRVFKLGRWYESKDEVRRSFGEYWKGILLSEGNVAIVFNYRGARRLHYGDRLDYKKGTILYIGEGKSGNQQRNARNAALIQAKKSQTPIDVFLDCGEVFTPKKLLYAGKWLVSGYRYTALSHSNARRVYKFSLTPTSKDILEFLRFSFSALGQNTDFEKDLDSFARSRSRIYAKHSSVIRSRDNVVGEIGEYFAIKAFNQHFARHHLIRLDGAHRDIDAIQVGTGRRVAIKTISAVPSSTSSIWSKNLAEAVDSFLICLIDQASLRPRFVISIGVRTSLRHLRPDRYQGSMKLNVSPAFLAESRFLVGRKSDWQG